VPPDANVISPELALTSPTLHILRDGESVVRRVSNVETVQGCDGTDTYAVAVGAHDHDDRVCVSDVETVQECDDTDTYVVAVGACEFISCM
jgi:hypothetical protein